MWLLGSVHSVVGMMQNLMHAVGKERVDELRREADGERLARLVPRYGSRRLRRSDARRRVEPQTFASGRSRAYRRKERAATDGGP
jgi:hypothetical protein